jgi:heme-degrading monooxygenase HmoA
MYARMMRFQVRPGMIDRMIDVVRDSLVPIAHARPGFRGGIALTERTAGEIIGLTLWETESDMVAGENDGYLQGNLEALTDLLQGAPVRQHLEVSLRA